MINRIVCDIGVEIDLILIPDGIGLQKPSQRGGVDPGLVIVHAEFGEVCLAGVLEPPGVAALRDAVFVVAVDSEHIGAGGVGDQHHRALPVAAQHLLAAGGGGGALEPGDRIVGLGVGAVNIAAQQGGGSARAAIVFGDQRIAVLHEPGYRAGDRGQLIEPPHRIVAQAGLERPGIAQAGTVAVAAALRALFDQAVLDIVEVDAGAIGGEIAVIDAVLDLSIGHAHFFMVPDVTGRIATAGGFDGKAVAVDVTP